MMRKKCLAMFTVLTVLASLALVSVPVQPSPSPVTFTVDMGGADYIPGQPVGTQFPVDILVNASDLTPDSVGGMAGWGIDVQVNPAVLKPLGASGGAAGYFLYDFLVAYGYNVPPWEMPYSLEILMSVDQAAGYIDDLAEMIVPIPAGGAGGTGKLITLWFESKSETRFSPIKISVHQSSDWQAVYMDTAENWVDVEVIDGQYNLPHYEANLVGRSGWKEHAHFDRSKSGDPLVPDSHGSPGLQTVYAKVKNTGVDENVTVKAEFELLKRTGDRSQTFNTTEQLLEIGQIAVLSANCTMFIGLDDGKWDLTVKCWYYNPWFDVWTQGTKVKTSSFTVVP